MLGAALASATGPAGILRHAQAGETYSPDFDTILPIFLRGEGDPICGPTEGEIVRTASGRGHVLRLSVRTWPLLGDPEPALLSRWKKFGEVWSKPLLSQPLLFEVEIPYKGPTTNCNAPDEQ